MGAVPAGSIPFRTAVERIIIGLRGRTRVESVVVIPHKVDTTNHLGPVDKSGAGIGQVRQSLGLFVGFFRAGTAKVGVGVVNPGIDYSDLDALTGVPGAFGPSLHGLRIYIAISIHALFRHNGGDALNIIPRGKRTDFLSIAVQGYAAHRIVHGITYFCTGILSRLASLILDLLLDRDGLTLLLNGFLLIVQNLVGLGLLVGTLTLELNEDEHISLRLFHGGGERI